MLRFAGDDNSNQAERYYGKYPGVVLDNKPRDGQKHVGELLVEVPGILEETPDGEGQRAMQVRAAPCFVPGFFFIPEVNAPIWVEFAAGDINHPIWTGVWYPPADTPPTIDKQSPTEQQKVIRTASGHTIQLDDTKDQEALIINHKSGSKIEIDKSGRITIEDVGNDTSIVSKKINLGAKGGAKEPLALGNTLKEKLDTLIEILMNHDHPTGVGPSGPPATKIADFINLRTLLDEILSKQNTTE